MTFATGSSIKRYRQSATPLSPCNTGEDLQVWKVANFFEKTHLNIKDFLATFRIQYQVIETSFRMIRRRGEVIPRGWIAGDGPPLSGRGVSPLCGFERVFNFKNDMLYSGRVQT
jgi:hypothetical protein